MAMISEHTDVVSAGVLAAELLAIACGSGNGLQAETVRNLAEDLGRGLRSPSDTGPAGPLVEASLACADLAMLAACNVAALPDRPRAVAATHLAAGAARALATLGESEIGTREDAYAENASRDLRSAGWKADLAVRQLGVAG
jgi:hypothetical protein